MSSYICEHCGQNIIDTDQGYITECIHHPFVTLGNNFDKAMSELASASEAFTYLFFSPIPKVLQGEEVIPFSKISLEDYTIPMYRTIRDFYNQSFQKMMIINYFMDCAMGKGIKDKYQIKNIGSVLLLTEGLHVIGETEYTFPYPWTLSDLVTFMLCTFEKKIKWRKA